MSGHPSSHVGRDEVLRLLGDEQAQLVEVLSEAAYRALHLAGAVNIPLDALDREQARRLDRDRPVIVYCYDYQ